jgi:hypothetical protein
MVGAISPRMTLLPGGRHARLCPGPVLSSGHLLRYSNEVQQPNVPPRTSDDRHIRLDVAGCLQQSGRHEFASRSHAVTTQFEQDAGCGVLNPPTGAVPRRSQRPHRRHRTSSSTGGAATAPIHRRRPDVVTFSARTCERSTAHRSRSSWPPVRSSASSSSCSRGHTPVRSRTQAAPTGRPRAAEHLIRTPMSPQARPAGLKPARPAPR